MTGFNAQRLVIGGGLAVLGAAVVFWLLAMSAANTGPKGSEHPSAPAVAGGPSAGDLARLELGEPTELVALDAGDLTQALGLVRESSVEGAEQ